MRVKGIKLECFRNISRAELSIEGSVVVIGGANAAGKTSMLEAISLVLGGRSFRTRQWQQLIQEGSFQTNVTAKIEKGERKHFVGASRIRGQLPVHRMDGEPAQLSSLAREFPLQIFDTGLFELFEGAPGDRRRFLDWGLFHVKHDFYACWRRYRHALKQRNALLRTDGVDGRQLDPWDMELTESGELLESARVVYAQKLIEACQANTLLDGARLDFRYQPGWVDGLSFAESISINRERDIAQGRTTTGPHLSDLRLRVSSRKAGDILSRGQKKLAGFALKIEQVNMYNSVSSSSCILLLDDFPAELDQINQCRILAQLTMLDSQMFITATETDQICKMLAEQRIDTQVFHVKHGEVSESPYPAAT